MNHLYTFVIKLIDRYNSLEWRPAFWGLGWRCCQWWSLDNNADRTPSHADILRQWLLLQIAVIPMQYAAFWFNQLKWLFFHNSVRITANRRAPKRLSLTGFNKRIFIQICSGLLWMKAITLLSQTLTGLPLDEWCLCFYSSAKESSVALQAPVGLFLSDVMVRKKYLFVEPLDIFAFFISNKIIQLSCGRIFLPSLPPRLSIIDVWGMDCLFTPNCPIGEAKRLTSQNSGCQQFGYWGHRWEMLIDCLHVGTWKFKEKMLPLKTRRKMMY